MFKPKPMIDGVAIIWHLMKYYSNLVSKFIICTGYKSNEIKVF